MYGFTMYDWKYNLKLLPGQRLKRQEDLQIYDVRLER